jgi:hypothetical protein
MRKDTDTNKNLLAELGYETRDIDIGKTLIGIGALFVFVAVTCGVSVAFYRWLEPPYKEYERPAFAAKRKLPPLPQIQAKPKEEIRYYHEANDRVVEASAIEQAKEQMAASGISGVTVGKEREEGKSYPGSGDYAPVGEAR